LKAIAGHAGALAAATPAALAAASEAQKLFAGGEVGSSPAIIESPASSPAPSSDLAEGVKTIADHAGALAAATPPALAAAIEAQKLFADDKAVDALAIEVATARMPAPFGALAEGVKKALADQAAAPAVAATAGLADASEAQKHFTGNKAEDAAAIKAVSEPMTAPSGELADGAKTFADQAEALAAAAPAALAASSQAQGLFPVREALSLSPPPAMPRPRREKDEEKLWQIEGVGKKLTRKLHEIGVWRFEQIAAWTPAQAAWVSAEIGEPGRVENENWIAQARLLAQANKTQIVGGEAGSPDAATAADTSEAPPEVARPAHAEDEDDLGLIRGIGDKIAGELHDLGVWRFSQIAAWTPEQQQWIGERLGHSGPVARKFWVAQAQLLAAGVDTDFVRARRAGDGGANVGSGEAGKPLDEATAAALHAALPEAIAPHANDALYAGLRPLSLLQPPYGQKDDLAAIEGIGDKYSERLHGLGVWTFEQIASWSDENARWIGSYLAFPGRVEREGWVEQAQALAMKKRTNG
jgi:predicted flap endonuclease-1-like 5' DNA nuclease